MNTPVTRSPSPEQTDDDDESFAGTRPASRAAAALGHDPRARLDGERRTCNRYKLQRDCMSKDYGSDMPESDLSFAMIELTADAERQALARAGQGMQVGAMLAEMQMASIYKIGDVPTRGNRKKLEAWFKALGPKGRKLVERAFNKLHTVTEDDEETFLATEEVSVE